MENFSSATETSSKEYLLRKSEQMAIAEVADRRGLLTDVRKGQRSSLEKLLLKDVRGGDGSDALGLLENKNELLGQIERIADQREQNFDDGVHVANLPGNIAGLQEDGNRRVTVDDALVHSDADAEMQKEVNRHERRHTEQSTVNHEGPVVLMGNEEIDRLLSHSSLQYREADAMREAGYKHTSSQYVTDYLHPVEKVEEYLQRGGLNGRELVTRAAVYGEIEKVRQSILQVALQPELQAA